MQTSIGISKLAGKRVSGKVVKPAAIAALFVGIGVFGLLTYSLFIRDVNFPVYSFTPLKYELPLAVAFSLLGIGIGIAYTLTYFESAIKLFVVPLRKNRPVLMGLLSGLLLVLCTT